MMKTFASLILEGSWIEGGPNEDDPDLVFLFLLDDGVGQLAVGQTHGSQGCYTWCLSFQGPLYFCLKLLKKY